MANTMKLFLSGAWQESQQTYEVRSPYHGEVVGVVSQATPDHLEQAIQAADQAFAMTRAIPSYQRADYLRAIARGLEDQAESFAHTIAQEAAKPIKLARAEVQRSIFTFAQAAEEATRLQGQTLNLDASPMGTGMQGIVRRFPVGPVAAITPFNFPLNLVAHKLAPALAAGCPVVLKPASQTPISALKLAALYDMVGVPRGALSVLPLASHDAAPLVEDERFNVLTFTGSPQVGWPMKARAGRKRVLLELGGNAAVIVHHDADVQRAALRIASGGFSYAGQSCISVQRVMIHRDIYQKFMSLFVPAVQSLILGDPMDETTDLSSVIRPEEGERIGHWIAEARAAGAEVVTGGEVRGGMVEPTILINADASLLVNCQEIFGPVVTVQCYEHIEEALAFVNASPYGLQAGVFTNTLNLVWQAYEALDVGGVMINEIPTWRVDHMPYGGVKQSGFGREGVKYAIEEMTEWKLLAIYPGSPG